MGFFDEACDAALEGAGQLDRHDELDGVPDEEGEERDLDRRPPGEGASCLEPGDSTAVDDEHGRQAGDGTEEEISRALLLLLSIVAGKAGDDGGGHEGDEEASGGAQEVADASPSAEDGKPYEAEEQVDGDAEEGHPGAAEKTCEQDKERLQRDGHRRQGEPDIGAHDDQGGEDGGKDESLLLHGAMVSPPLFIVNCKEVDNRGDCGDEQGSGAPRSIPRS